MDRFKTLHSCCGHIEDVHVKKVKVKVSHSLLAVGAVGARVPLYLGTRARENDKCKSVQPFYKQSAISVSFTETTDRPFPRSRKLPTGSFHNDRPFPDIR